MKLKNKDECTGCGLCSNVCPAECIKMERDSEGFYYPFVNQKICVVCGRCEKYCYNTVTNPPKEVHVYAAYNKDLIRRLKASSGGIFELLSNGWSGGNPHVCRNVGRFRSTAWIEIYAE